MSQNLGIGVKRKGVQLNVPLLIDQEQEEKDKGMIGLPCT